MNEHAPAEQRSDGRPPADGRRAAALSPRFVLRAAGLPIEAVHGLRGPLTRRWADELLAEEEQLAELGARLGEPLAALVRAAPDERLRRQVLAVRRAVFNHRPPRDVSDVLALAGRSDGPAHRLLADWLDARHRLTALQARGEAVLAGELVHSRAELRRLAGLPVLRLGLLLASPTLDGKLDAFIAGPATAPDKRGRKMERSLLSYLYRTACKTSPFSTLTTVSPGVLRPPPDGLTAGPDGQLPSIPDLLLDGEPAGHVRLNVVVLSRLAELVAADPERRRDLPLTVASGWALDEDRVRYVRRSVTAGDDNAAVSFDAAQDRLFFLRLSGALEQVLELLRAAPLVRYRELAALLATGTGAGPVEAEQYLTALLDLGILQLPWLTTDVHSRDPLRSFQRALRDLDRPWAGALADRLDGPAGCLAGYPAAGTAGRRSLLARLRRDLLDVQRALGAPEPSLPQTLLYEDVAGPPVVADAAPWARLAAGPLESLTRILPLFDVALAQRLTLKGFFLVRYGRGGRCEDLLKLVHDFHEDIFNQYLQFTSQRPAAGPDGAHPPEENWLGMPEITALDRARSELTVRMTALWEGRAAGAEELELDDATVAAAAAELAPLPRGFEPYSHFLQLARRDGDPLVVLNNSYGGLCFPFTRFTHCFDPAEDSRPEPAGPTPAAGDAPGAGPAAGLVAGLRETLRGLRPPGSVFAEVTAGAATTNLNLHARLTEFEIVCPGETSTAPSGARIQLDDLYVEHDPAADRLVLRSRRLRREVVPLYLGYLVPMVLPEIPRTLLLFSPTSRVTPDAWRGVPAGPADGGVTHRPRLRHGSLVLHRRSWSAGPGALPEPRPGEGEAARYLAWQRWRRRHGLPAQVFARVRPEPGPGGAAGWQGAAKPQYVDFDSPLSLTALDALLAGGPARVVLEEMLPGEQALHVRSPLGRHVAELAVETVPRAAAAAAPQQQGAHGHD
ncbi:lantibiotic dehydratase [Streptomyces sp. CB03911]|uniref:lantibiotic dehydratase n=1 Tax=Streptomycetaceae TaxID=2062 RepID=UPI000ACE481D|nr:lantibiotic dehydratase [Streptomyces sp. CB03911]